MKRPSSSEQIPKESQEINAAFTGFDSMEACMLGLMTDGKIAYVNQSTCDMLGYPKEELIGVSIRTVAPGMTTEAWSAFWSEVDRKGAIENQAPLMLHLSNQEDLQVRYRAICVQAAGQKGCVMFLSKPEQIPTAVVDIQANRAQFVQILDAMANPVISMDGQHRVSFINKAACRMLGTTLSETVGKTVFDYLPKKYADAIWKKEQEVLDSGKPATFLGNEFFKANYGESFSILPYCDSSSSQKRLLVIINKAPTTGQFTTLLPKPGEPKPGLAGLPYLAELRRYMEKGAIGIYVKDTDNRIVWLNQSYAAMVGFAPKELIGKRVDDVINDPELMAVLRKEDESVYASGRPLFNLIKQPLNDNEKFLRIDKIPFIDKNRKIAGIIGLAVEIDAPPSEVEALQEKLSSTSRKLADTETAMQVLLEHRDKDLSLTKDKLADKIKSLVLPYLENLKQTPMQQDQLEYVHLIEENLKNFYDLNYAKLSAPEYKLSPTELKVSQLVRDGKTNKEIAKMLHLSKSTILTHRHHIRVKLGIKNKKVNLRSLLKS